MATYKNESEETFVFPSLGLVIKPGDTFDADGDITTEGIVAVSGKKKADPAPVDPAPAELAVAPETPSTEEIK